MRLLIVDDSVVMRETIAFAARALGHTVVASVATVAAARAAWRDADRAVDVVVVDGRLPAEGNDGGAVRAVAAAAMGAAIVAIVPFDDRAALARVAGAGATRAVVRPVTVSSLDAALRDILTGSSSSP